jgi:beta-lactamase class A
MLNYSTLMVEKTHKYKDAIKLLNKIRFIGHEPAILDKVEILLKKAENPTPTQSPNQAPGAAPAAEEEGVSG